MREEEQRKAIEIEKEWMRLQSLAGEEKEQKAKHFKRHVEAAEVALGVQHKAAKAVKKNVRAKEREAKLAAAKERIDERQRKEYARLFPKRHDEISQAAVKKEQAEQRLAGKWKKIIRNLGEQLLNLTQPNQVVTCTS